MLAAHCDHHPLESNLCGGGGDALERHPDNYKEVWSDTPTTTRRYKVQ